jgi:hypothetical protein
MSEIRSADGPRAAALVRAWLLSTAAVASFAILWLASTQVRAVRAHSPWSDDPYDAVLSVASLVLPFVWAVTTVRLLRWRAAPILPVAAARTIVRGVGVVLALVWAPELACVVALALRARHGAWGPWLGWLQALVALTGLAGLVAGVDLVRTSARLRSPGGEPRAGWGAADDHQADQPAEPDALDDLAVLLETTGRSLARSNEGGGRLLASVGTAVATVASARWGPRRHRVAWCLALGLGFGVMLAAWHGIAEGAPDHWPTALLVGAVFASVGAAIVVVSYACLGTYLRLIRPEDPPAHR